MVASGIELGRACADVEPGRHEVKKKRLSNSFSTGGGGGHFEANVQASFVTLMITGGYSPCLPRWPIVEVKLQGKIDGFDTDDLIVFVEDPESKERRKLLGQVKHAISITKGDKLFGEVLQAAWNDFNNSAVFVKDRDAIALITGPMSARDQHNVSWLLEQARRTKDAEEFYRRVEQTNFSPPYCGEKLEAIRFHLGTANGGEAVSNTRLYEFLRRFHLLGYDLDNDAGVALSLLHSHISQFHRKFPEWAWARIVEIVQTWNRAAGNITTAALPDDLLDVFRQQTRAVLEEFPKELAVTERMPATDWGSHPEATFLALALLVGTWNESNQSDIQEISTLFRIDYELLLQKARGILHLPDSPISIKDGIWKISRRLELWPLLGSRILDQDLESFKTIVVKVLKERDPAFEMPPGERYAANIYGKVTTYSPTLRKGLSEGLALLGSHPEAASNCSRNKAEVTSLLAVREILADAEWAVWGSLNNLLPNLAEAAPTEFIGAVESALTRAPSPFDKLFCDEGDGVTGGNYLTGLLWALEGLAWDAELLVRVCVVLSELASHDPGGNWANRPSNSLVTILLPWLPQTLGSIEKRQVAVRTVLSEQPATGWSLLLHLLPGHHQTSSGSHRPNWRTTIPDDWKKGVSKSEYWEQIFAYSELAVSTADTDPVKLTGLISQLNDLPRPAFDELVSRLGSASIVGLPENQRREIWNALIRFASKHRKYAEATWALPGDAVKQIEEVAETLAPKNPFDLYQHLFTERDFDLYEEKGGWQEQQRKLDEKRESAIRDILISGGISEVVRFAKAVRSARRVGLALGGVGDEVVDQYLLPNFLDNSLESLRNFVSSYIWQRYRINGWGWCDSAVKPDWTLKQKATFLCQLPFSRDTWSRVAVWLEANEGLYWSTVWANPYQSENDISFAVTKLIEFKRPHPAIDCLCKMLHDKQVVNTEQIVQALLLAVSCPDTTNSMDTYHIVELIQFLQSEASVSEDDLFKVEWAYLPLLDSLGQGRPKLLERKMATEPEFFCEVIRLVYRAKKESAPSIERSEREQAIATNAWRLLHDWSIPPGTQSDGSFSGQHFSRWLDSTKAICAESGHLEVALIHVGEVLIHAPSDTNGLWMDSIVASALNDRNSEHLRRGFSTAIYNSRGAHWVDPTGQPERELAKEYRRKAEDIENAGFQRFAATLREVATGYDREADKIIADHQGQPTGGD
jgi:hypothetical protein